MRWNVLTSPALFAALAVTALPAVAAPSSAPEAPGKGVPMTHHAKGTFDVKVVPVPLSGPVEDPTLSRFAVEKQLHGDLEGTGKGQMLAAGDPSTGNGAYVAIERVTATLGGRSGSFALQHRGTMTAGVPQIDVTVVPGSGAGQLTGIAGTFTIIMANGQHSYDFSYTLPAAP
jgi:Protein of unknown function (DUF3224)